MTCRRFLSLILVCLSVIVIGAPPKDAVAAVSLTALKATAGYTHGCAVMTDGTVRCWGNNASGQIGDGTTTSRSSAGVLVSGITDAIDVGVNPGNYESANRSCALLASGQIRCWGVNYSNSDSYLGTGDTVSSYRTPVPVCRSGSYSAGTCIPLENVMQMSIDGYGGCGLVSTNNATTVDNRVYCWGEVGQAGILNAVPVCTSGTVAANTCVEFTDAVKIDSNQYHRCARTSDNRAFCWGTNSKAQLGRESASPSTRWQAASIQQGGVDISDVVDITAAASATCIIRSPIAPSTTNRIQCVGDTYYGHLGDGVNGTSSFVATWTDICGHSRTTPAASTCSSTTLPGSATRLVGGSTQVCAYIADGYGTNDEGWSCWSGSSGLLVYLARPSSSTGTVYGYIGQLCSASTTYSANGECGSGKRFTATDVDMSGSTPCGVMSGNVYCWGMGGGGSITGQNSWVYYPSLISMGASLRFQTTPSEIEVGSTFGQQPTLQLVGANGQDVSTSGVSVTASIQAISGSGTLGGTTTSITDASGRATFTDLQISATGNYVLSFSATGYGGIGQSVVLGTLTSRTLAITTQFAASYSANASIPSITSTASAGTGTKTYASTTTGICSVNQNSGAISVVSTGTCTVQARIANDGNYVTATSSTVSFSITRISRSVTIASSSYTNSYTLPVSGPTLVASLSAGSGTIAFTSLTLNVCQVGSLSGVITFLLAGTCQIHASVAANGNYDGDTSPTISMTVSAVATTSTTTTPTPPVTSAPTNTSAPVTTVSNSPVSTIATETTAPRGMSAILSSTTTTLVGSNTLRSNSSTSSTTTSPTSNTQAPPEPVLPEITVPDTPVGGASAIIDGKNVTAEITRVNNELKVQVGPIAARIWGITATGAKVPLDADGRLRLMRGDLVTVNVEGFSSGSVIEVRMYSDPVLLGRSTVSDTGLAFASYEIPESTTDGNHRVVMLGKTSSGDATFSLSIVVGEKGQRLTTWLITIPLVFAAVGALILPVALRRRRRTS